VEVAVGVKVSVETAVEVKEGVEVNPRGVSVGDGGT
jgi:hypothetical protein